MKSLKEILKIVVNFKKCYDKSIVSLFIDTLTGINILEIFFRNF